MKKTLFSLILSSLLLPGQAQDFDTYFTDRTLRVDYLFTGDAQKQEVTRWRN